jgi:hypothetical protein
MPIRYRRAAAAAAAVLALAAAGCSSSGSSHAAQGKAAASSIAANPTVSSELNQSEQLLLANIQANFSAAHPYKSLKAGIRATYPNGSTTQIINFGVKHFTIAVVHPLHGHNPARDAWLLLVTNYAQSLGAKPEVPATVPATAPSGQPAIPGVTSSPSPSTSTTGGNG